MNKILKCGVALIGASAAVIALIGCSSINNSKNNVTGDSWNKKVEAPAELPIATIKIKDYGVITAKLYPDKAPNTVNNFISLANSRPNFLWDGDIGWAAVNIFTLGPINTSSPITTLAQSSTVKL